MSGALTAGSDWGTVELNVEEHALLILMEECAEVAHAASKIIRFGWDEKNPYDPNALTNREQLDNELADLFGTMLYLEMQIKASRAERKMEQIEKYWEKYQDERNQD